MARRDACWRRCDRTEFHCPGCRPGRPRCRYRRAQLAGKKAGGREVPPCDCPAYAFPHRAQGGICGNREAFAVKVYGPSVSKVYAVECTEAAAE